MAAAPSGGQHKASTAEEPGELIESFVDALAGSVFPDPQHLPDLAIAVDLGNSGASRPYRSGSVRAIKASSSTDAAIAWREESFSFIVWPSSPAVCSRRWRRNSVRHHWRTPEASFCAATRSGIAVVELSGFEAVATNTSCVTSLALSRSPSRRRRWRTPSRCDAQPGVERPVPISGS